MQHNNPCCHMETTVLCTHCAKTRWDATTFSHLYNVNVEGSTVGTRALDCTLSRSANTTFPCKTIIINIRYVSVLYVWRQTWKERKYRWKTQPIFFSLFFFLNCLGCHRCGCIKLCQHRKGNIKLYPVPLFVPLEHTHAYIFALTSDAIFCLFIATKESEWVSCSAY